MPGSPELSGRKFAVVVAAAAALAGCAGKAPPPCPRAAILRDAGELTRFAPGPGRDLLDVAFTVETPDLAAACERRKGATQVAVAPVFVVSRGPSNPEGLAAFSYFVSVVGPDQSILNKQEFPVTVTFTPVRSRITQREDDPPVIVELPPGAPVDRFQVLVGLQLTPEELEHNMRRP